jgi:multidrug efflux pump subunit AcrA (membrane-fusion protein)
MTTAGRKYALGCVVLGSLAAVFLAAWPPSGPAGEPESKDAPPKTLKLPGEIVAVEQTKLFARVVGFVQKVNVDIGDRVKKGQVLAELAVPEMEADLKQKEARVAQAEAEVRHAKQSLDAATATVAVATAQVAQAEATVKQAQAALQFRKAEQERFQKLFEQKTITAEILDERTQHLEAAKATVVEAESKLQVARASREAVGANHGALEAEVLVAEARRKAAAADVQRQAALLDYARITAPFDGIVTERTASVGMLAGPPSSRGERLFTVDRVDTVRVIVDVPENDAPRVQTGAQAVVEIAALGGQRFEGKITRTAGTLGPKTRTLRAEINLPNRDGKLFPGMTGTVTIKPGPD